MAMVLSILMGAPLWVWPLLVFLIYFGLKATRQRTAASWPIYLLTMLGLLSVNAVNTLPAAGYIWIVFGLAYLGGAIGGSRFQKTIIREKVGTKVTFAGEWLTFVVIMIVFWMNFAGGVFKAIAPDIYNGSPFHIAFATIAGLAAGSFLGRALRVYLFPSD